MNQSGTISKETYSYFKFITNPFAIQKLYSPQEIINSPSQQSAFLGKYFSEKNLDLFLLVGEDWELFYVDIETPILFLTA
ncbi:MAG: hypothetical protein ACTSW1_06160, partial [Candidatus Hodarchaeales archaeon]